MRGSKFTDSFTRRLLIFLGIGAGRGEAPFLCSGVSELRGIRMSVEGEHPIEVTLCKEVSDHGS